MALKMEFTSALRCIIVSFSAAMLLLGGRAYGQSICEADCADLEPYEWHLDPAKRVQEGDALLSFRNTDVLQVESPVTLRLARHSLEFDRFTSGLIASKTDVATWSLVAPRTAVSSAYLSEIKATATDAKTERSLSAGEFVPVNWAPRETLPSVVLIAIVFAAVALIGTSFNRRMKIQRVIGLPSVIEGSEVETEGKSSKRPSEDIGPSKERNPNTKVVSRIDQNCFENNRRSTRNKHYPSTLTKLEMKSQAP